MKPTKKAVELPFDVHAYTISFLRDYATLLSCTLVCRAWLPIARSNLYYSVSLHSREQWNAFERVLLEAETSDVGTYLGRAREFHVTPPYGSNDKGWADMVVSRCTKYLTGLNILSVANADWSISLDSVMLSPPKHDLATLTIREMAFRDAFQLYQFMAFFPGLEILTLDSIHLNTYDLPSEIPEAPFRLKRLDYCGWEEDGTLIVGDLLAKAGALRNLTSLTCAERDATKPITDGIDDASLQLLDCVMDETCEGLSLTLLSVISRVD